MTPLIILFCIKLIGIITLCICTHYIKSLYKLQLGKINIQEFAAWVILMWVKAANNGYIDFRVEQLLQDGPKVSTQLIVKWVSEWVSE